MRIHPAIGVLCLFGTAAMAQRGGGHASGGGFRGGASGIPSSRGGFGGGYRTGGFGGYGGFGAYGGYRGYSGHRGYSFGLGYYPWYGYGYWPGYWGGYYSYPYGYYGYYDYSDPPVYEYNPPPQTTVIQPPPPPPSYNLYVAPNQGGYDQYGQPIAAAPAPAETPGRSPIYLIAFKDHTIRAAESYSVSGDTLHYVTLEHQEKQAPLESVDRGLSAQLNRERHVAFALPNR